MFSFSPVASDVSRCIQVDFAGVGICAFCYENKDYLPDGTKGEKLIKSMLNSDVDMKKAEGVLHKYAKVFLPFTHFKGMPSTIDKSCWELLKQPQG